MPKIKNNLLSHLTEQMEEIQQLEKETKETETEINHTHILKTNPLRNHLFNFSQKQKQMISDYKLNALKCYKLLLELTEEDDSLEITPFFEDLLNTIKSKDAISTKEFSVLYGISQTTQSDYRGRVKNEPLPFEQHTINGKIVYIRANVEDWFLRNNINY